MVSLIRDYKVILGNKPELDELDANLVEIEGLKERINYLEGTGSLSFPESAIVKFLRKQRIEFEVDRNKAYATDQPRFVMRQFVDRRGVLNQVFIENLSRHVAKPNDSDLLPLAQALTNGFPTKEEKAQAIVNFVQTSIRYPQEDLAADERGGSMKSPQRTLIDGKGDCKDHVILAASLLNQLGIRPVILYLRPKSPGQAGHVRLGIPGDFAKHPPRYSTKDYFPDNTLSHRGRIYFIAEVTINAPTYIGARLDADRDVGSIEYVQEI